MPNYPDFLSFIDAYARRLARSGNARTSETYLSAGRSFKEFLCGARPTFSQITGRLMESYELWLHGRNLTRNTSSFYMRILRAAYNRGVERGYTRQRDPFRHVYTGVDRTRKRAVTLPVIKKNQDDGLKRKARFGIVTRPVPVQFLYPGDVVHRHGLPEDQRP